MSTDPAVPEEVPAEPESAAPQRSHRAVEIVAAVILGVAGLLTAYAAYQSSQADGEALEGYTRSAKTTADANGYFNEAVAKYSNDQALFLEYALQAEQGNQEAADAIRQTLFTPELEAATAAWVETGDDGPPTPLDMDEYVVPAQLEAVRLTNQAETEFSEAQSADEAGSKFSLAAVFLAVALFLGGIASLFQNAGVRIALLIGAAAFIVPGAVAILGGQAAM
ncbi:MAG: DUF4337 family protein [Candidatus Nanopelagicales bacterium]